jgi:hypothetical protein
MFLKSKLAVLMMVLVLLAPAARADQPHMQAALNSLQQAREQLKKATSDKGGHRQNALQLIDQAIAQVRQGIAFDAANPKNGKKKKNQ